MKAQTSTARLAVAALAVAGVPAAAAAPAPPQSPTAGETAPRAQGAAKRAGPHVRQMVVLRNGGFAHSRVRAARATAEVGRRTCAVAAATPLAALLRARPGRIALHDYGSCSRRAADSAGLFVKSIRGQVNSGLDGWVYKVGRRLGIAGAADPSGPFGDGRLSAGDGIVWFYCVFDDGSCQRSLELAARVDGAELSVSVAGYDDAGEGGPVAGARVVAVAVGGRGRRTAARTGADGRATLRPGRGRFVVHAARRGTIRAFPRRVAIGR